MKIVFYGGGREIEESYTVSARTFEEAESKILENIKLRKRYFKDCVIKKRVITPSLIVYYSSDDYRIATISSF